MKLEKIHINGYKSLRDVTVRLHSGLTTIIGVNDVGKSSVLQAIDIVLNDLKPETMDFHNNTDEIRITLTFRIETDAERSKLQDLISITSDKFAITKVFAVDGDKVKSPEILLEGTKVSKPQWKDLREVLPQFIYVESLRNAEDISRITTNSTLGKLLLPLIRDVATHKKDIEGAFRDKVEDLRKDLEQYLIEQTPNIKNLDIDPIIQLEKAIELNIDITDSFNYSTNVKRRGSGVQSSLVVGVFRLYAKHGIGENIVFGIEEPEAFLHAGAQRQLFSALQEVARNDAQVVVTTHSPIFIDRGQLAGISLLKRTHDGGVEVKRIKHEGDLHKIAEALEFRNSDLLLWNGIVFVEGGSDVEFFKNISRVVLEEWHCSFDSLGINVLSVTGKNNMAYIANATVLSSFGIPFLVVMDRDNDAINDIRERLSKLYNLPTSKIIVLSKRELENYYPPESIIRAFPNISLDGVVFGDDVDVKEQLLKRSGVSEVTLARSVAKHIRPDEIHSDLINVIVTAVGMVDSELASRVGNRFYAGESAG